MATEYAIQAATDPTTGKVFRNAGLMQAYALRQLAFDLAREVGLAKPDELNDTLRARASSVAQLIRAWSEADERGRIARGKPLPGSRKPDANPKPRQRQARGAVWTESEPTIVPTSASGGS